jgi:capsular exopolysaccharide synthesis family protein
VALEAQEQDAFSKGGKGMRYEFARQDYQANRLLYDGLQQRLQEASIMAGLHSTSIHIVDIADTPVFWSRPRTKVNQAVGIGIGLLIGMLLAIILEAIDINLKSISDIEQGLQLPILGAIPVVKTEELLPTNFKESAVTRDVSRWSKIAESFRAMRTSILLSSAGSPPKVIVIASTRPGEGKTSIASLIAITLAFNGSKVLLVDGDLRRPAIHLQFRIGKGSGLSSVLSGKASLREAIEAWSDLPNLHILPSGPVPPLPSELLGSTQMENQLAQMRADYDFVVIDTPPSLVVTDASILSRLADATILVLRYGTTRRQVVLRCLDLLDRSGAHLLGVTVNAVDFQSPEYSEYYGKKVYDYYGERESEQRKINV